MLISSVAEFSPTWFENVTQEPNESTLSWRPDLPNLLYSMEEYLAAISGAVQLQSAKGFGWSKRRIQLKHVRHVRGLAHADQHAMNAGDRAIDADGLLRKRFRLGQ